MIYVFLPPHCSDICARYQVEGLGPEIHFLRASMKIDENWISNSEHKPQPSIHNQFLFIEHKYDHKFQQLSIYQHKNYSLKENS